MTDTTWKSGDDGHGPVIVLSKADDAETDRWRSFVAQHPSAWVTHTPVWCATVDGPLAVFDMSFALADGSGRWVAVVPCHVRRSGEPVLVSGLNEPAGPLLTENLSAAERRAVWGRVDERLEDRARNGAALDVALKFPVLDRTGVRSVRDDDVDALRDLGYRVETRSCFVMDLSEPREELWRGVSSQVRTSIRAAARTCTVQRPTELTDVLNTYTLLVVHARNKGMEPLVSPTTLPVLEDSDELDVVNPLLAKAEGRAVGFALSFGIGGSASLVSWGANQQGLEHGVSKLMVWEALADLQDAGVRLVEYGGAISGVPEHEELTEFYRRFGGTIIDTVQAVRPVRTGPFAP